MGPTGTNPLNAAAWTFSVTSCRRSMRRFGGTRCTSGSCFGGGTGAAAVSGATVAAGSSGRWHAVSSQGFLFWPSSSKYFSTLPARRRGSLVRARGGLFQNQFERLFLSVWPCRIILPSSALFCRCSALWEMLSHVTIRTGSRPWAQSVPPAAPAKEKPRWQSRSTPPPTRPEPRDHAARFHRESSPRPGMRKMRLPDPLRPPGPQSGHSLERPSPSLSCAAPPAPSGYRSRWSAGLWCKPTSRRVRWPLPAARTRRRTGPGAPSSAPRSWRRLTLHPWSSMPEQGWWALTAPPGNAQPKPREPAAHRPAARHEGTVSAAGPA